MRTTIDITDELLREARRAAAEEGISVREVVHRALRLFLGRSPPRKGYRLRWRTEKGRLLPGVRLDDRDALFDLMEGRG